MKYKVMAMSVFLIPNFIQSEQVRTVKHEPVWQEFLGELQKLDCCDLELPKTPADASALQARGLSKILQWLQDLKNTIQFQLAGGDSKEVIELLQKISCEIYQLESVIGKLNDESVADLPSVAAIDAAQLTQIQWLKSIYRFLLEHHTVS